MARSFFDIENGGGRRDETGAEGRDLDEVRTIAVRDAAGASVPAMALTPTTAWSIRAQA